MDKNKKYVKTTIAIEEELWRKFTIKVIEKHGLRMNGEVIKEFIASYTKLK